MKHQLKFLYFFASVVLLFSCEEDDITPTISTTYIDGLEGTYSIHCTYYYLDAGSNYVYVDTNYEGEVINVVEDEMAVEFHDGTSFLLSFSHEHYVYDVCGASVTNQYVLGDWSVEGNIPEFSINVYDPSCITGIQGSSDLAFSATKL